MKAEEKLVRQNIPFVELVQAPGSVPQYPYNSLQ